MFHIMQFLGAAKIINPALHLIRVTGFLGDRGPFQILFPSFGVERRNLVRKYCWLLFMPNSSKSQWKLCPLISACAVTCRCHNRRFCQIRPSNFGFWVADCGFHVFETIITDGFDRSGHNWRTFQKILHSFWLNPDWLSFYGYDEWWGGS